eukprot:COSAG04_NODE_11706_length_693_cov_1.015152_2_plen_33_part_01
MERKAKQRKTGFSAAQLRRAAASLSRTAPLRSR